MCASRHVLVRACSFQLMSGLARSVRGVATLMEHSKESLELAFRFVTLFVKIVHSIAKYFLIVQWFFYGYINIYGTVFGLRGHRFSRELTGTANLRSVQLSMTQTPLTDSTDTNPVQ